MPNNDDKKLNFVAKVFDPVTQTYRPIYIAPDGTDTVQGDVFLSDDIDETKTAADGMTAMTPAGVYNAITKYFENVENVNPYRNTTVGSEGLPIFIEEGKFKEITGIDASLITSGTISLDRLPQGALERLITVENQAARFALTTTTVQLGDTVKENDSGNLFIIVDESNLNNEKGYTQFSAGTSTEALEANHAKTADKADVADKLGTTTVGDTQTPVYINNGVPETVNRVKNANVADKLTTVDITNNTDLDTLTDSNKYYSCQFNTVAPTLINCPTNKAFSLRVEYINAINNCFVQILTTYTGQMWFRTHDGKAFVTGWQQIYPANVSTATGVLPATHGGTGATTLAQAGSAMNTALNISEGAPALDENNRFIYISGSQAVQKKMSDLWSAIEDQVEVTKVQNAAYADKADTANSSIYSVYLKNDATITNTMDLNTFKGASYWNRTYKASGGNTVKNKPSGVDAFGLWVGRNADGWSYQLLVSSNAGNTVWYRTAADTGTLGAWNRIYPATNADTATKATSATSADSATTASSVPATGITGIMPIAKGGTGASDRGQAYHNLSFIGVNPTQSVSDDTQAKWKSLGEGWAQINTKGIINDQPLQWGHIINFVNGDEIRQIWTSQPSGGIYTRGANSSTGIMPYWTEVYTEQSALFTRHCIVGQSGATDTNPWYKFATWESSAGFDDGNIVFDVYKTMTSGSVSGQLHAWIRTNGSGVYEGSHFYWTNAVGITASDWVLAHNTGTSPTKVELWARMPTPYCAWMINVNDESNRTTRGYEPSKWKLITKFSTGDQAAVTAGMTQQVSTFPALSNPVASATTATTATTATQLSTSSAGSSTRPVYWSGGIPVAMSSALSTSYGGTGLTSTTNTSYTSTYFRAGTMRTSSSTPGNGCFCLVYS